MTMVPSLSTGSINKILGGEDVPNAVIQILGCKKIPGAGNDRYRLLISDGVTGCPFAMLGTQLNQMVANKELEKFTVIRVDRCVCNQVQADRKVIILLSLTVLVPGNEINEKLGNPSNSNAVTSAEKPSENGINGTVHPSSKPLFQKNLLIENPNLFDRNPTLPESSAFENGAPTTYPINTLTPYQNKWTIKARVTSKTPLRTYSSSRGEGKVFSVNLLDESGEIKATGFNETADRFYEMFAVNKVYYISKGNLKPANAKYNTVKHDYELTFNNDSVIMPCDESSLIPMMQYDFLPIDQLEQVDKDANVDVIGVVKSVGEIQTFVARTTNKELTKRDVKLVDRSNREVSLTLWGREAESFGEGSSNPIVAIKGARVSDFNGRSLSVTMSSTMTVNPDIKEAHVLKGWYEREGCNMESQSISNSKTSGSMGGQWKTFAQVVSEKLGMGDKPDYYINKATVVMIRKENCMYMACPTPECNKKVIDMNNGVYRCEKCDREYPEFKWRLLLSLSVADYTENQWVTCFQEAAESVLKVTAQDLGSYKESDEEKFNEIMADANFESYILKLRTKRETYNEESRMKTTIVTVTKLEPVNYTRKILNDVKLLQQEI